VIDKLFTQCTVTLTYFPDCGSFCVGQGVVLGGGQPLMYQDRLVVGYTD